MHACTHTGTHTHTHTHLPIKVISASGIHKTARANLLQQDIHQLIAAFAVGKLFPARESTLHVVCTLFPVGPVNTIQILLLTIMQDTYKAPTTWLKSAEEYNERKKSSTSEYFEC